ncbi:hypothetical protein [Variovorax paradoxus]|uniref:hypothetical protein n=1 Tax=Variovorax paradoxus TaxID=34073 RepID=UPI003ED0AEC6
MRRAFETLLWRAAQAFSVGEQEKAVRMLTVGINGDDPQLATSAEGLHKRVLNAYAMEVLSRSSKAIPLLTLSSSGPS